jgi:hypothetical protein
VLLHARNSPDRKKKDERWKRKRERSGEFIVVGLET